MKNINAYSVRALVALVLLSLLVPITGQAQNATPVAETPIPTEVVTDPDTEVLEEQEETSTTEATVEAAPSGQRMAPLADGGPAITVDGETGTVVVGGGRVVSIDFPENAVGSRFSDANCTNRTGSWSHSSYQYVFSPGTYSVQARAGSEYGAAGNCVTIVVVEVPLIMFNGSLEPPYLAPNEAVNISSTAGSEWGMFNTAGCIGSPINGTWSSAAGLHSSSSLTTTWFMARSIQYPQLTGPCTPVHVVIQSDTTPTVTLFGSTEPAFVPRFFWARPETPEGAELGEFSRADCSGDPDDGWVRSIGVSPSTYPTMYFQARWKDDDSTRGNCLAVTWEPVSEPVLTSKVCGDNNDIVTPPKVQTAISFTDTGWVNNERTITLVNDRRIYSFPSNQQTVFVFEDDGPCEPVTPIPPVQTEICGTSNDVISFASDQPAGVIVNQSESWSEDSIWTVTFSAETGFIFPADTVTEYVFTDEGPCETGAPVEPVQTEVCGTNNDVISFSGDQPENVIVTQSDDWSPEGTWTVTFSAAEHYKLPVDTQAEYVFTDAAVPCPTDAPAPPVQSAVCGPDNDLITIPDDQPEAITLDSDSGWENNTRTITFAVAPDFQTDGPTTFTFTDSAEPCPIPTINVTVELQTSDGGSIAGSPWQLYAPVAAQLPITDPYLEGTVGAGNQIELDDLIAGQYRLVVNADGYEPIDETFMIEAGDADHVITLQVTAIQIPAETPTPSPTSTVEPSPTPASTAAAVSALPNTGSGSGSGSGMPGVAYLIGLVLTVAGIGAVTRRPVR